MLSTQGILTVLRKQRELEQENNLSRVGYWLVRSSDKARFYISKDIDCNKLEQVCNKVLTEKTGYDYWVDYCLGLDITGRTACCNIDQSDSFM